MNTLLRRILTSNSLSRRLYYTARQAYHTRSVARRAGRYFLNADEFKGALSGEWGIALVDLRTADGLTIRPNYGDAYTLAEIFVNNCYARDLNLPPKPGRCRCRRL